MTNCLKMVVMGRKSLSLRKTVLLVLPLIFTINVNADVTSCSTLIPLSVQAIDASSAQPQSKTSNVVKTNKKQKAKSSFSYFGMFKLLIPDTLK